MRKQRGFFEKLYTCCFSEKNKIVLKTFCLLMLSIEIQQEIDKEGQGNSVKETKPKIFFSEIDFQFRCLFW